MFETFEEKENIFEWEETVGIVDVGHNEGKASFAIISWKIVVEAVGGAGKEFIMDVGEDVGEDKASK